MSDGKAWEPMKSSIAHLNYVKSNMVTFHHSLEMRELDENKWNERNYPITDLIYKDMERYLKLKKK